MSDAFKLPWSTKDGAIYSVDKPNLPFVHFGRTDSGRKIASFIVDAANSHEKNSKALDEIAALLEGKAWNELAADVATILENTGRNPKELEDEE